MHRERFQAHRERFRGHRKRSKKCWNAFKCIKSAFELIENASGVIESVLKNIEAYLMISRTLLRGNVQTLMFGIITRTMAELLPYENITQYLRIFRIHKNKRFSFATLYGNQHYRFLLSSVFLQIVHKTYKLGFKSIVAMVFGIVEPDFVHAQHIIKIKRPI